MYLRSVAYRHVNRISKKEGGQQWIHYITIIFKGFCRPGEFPLPSQTVDKGHCLYSPLWLQHVCLRSMFTD